MTDNPNDRKISETPGVKDVLDEAAEQIEKAWREKLLRETADLKTENALLRAQLDKFNRKLAEATDMIDICKENNIKLVFAASPHYKTASFIRYAPIIKICKEKQIPFISFYNDEEISLNKKYFIDSKHMNIEGAKLFTKKFVHELKSRQIEL